MAIGENKSFQLKNETKNINSQCKVVVYRWKVPVPSNDTSDKDLGESTRLDISSQIVNCTYSKNMAQPTGTFSFTLSNSPNIKGSTGDWKDIIKRGEWCVIYMSQDGDLSLNPIVGSPLRESKKLEEAKKIRCIGYIDRVAPHLTVGEKGEFDVTYTVQGRDFGVVYENTDIWHNLFQFEQIMLQSLANNELNITGATKLHVVLDIVHDLFFNPQKIKGAKVNDNKSLTSIALQWMLPRQMIQDIFSDVPLGSSSFWGELPVKKFEETEAGLAVERPTDYLSGNAWDQLKKISVPAFHELFTETDDSGKPFLKFRPIPFALNKKGYKTIGEKITLYRDISPVVKVSSIDVIDADLAEDDHGRYNSFLTTVTSTLINTEDNISVLKGSGFPEFQQASIKRHGFRPMHVDVDTIIKNAAKDSAKSDRKLLIEFNELLKDYWNNYIFTSSGTVNQIGNNLVKVGKAYVFNDDVPYEARKRYYIEGYSDNYEVDEKGTGTWTQNVMLTRGLEESDLKSGTLKSERNTEFTNEGEYTPSGSNRNKS